MWFGPVRDARRSTQVRQSAAWTLVVGGRFVQPFVSKGAVMTQQEDEARFFEKLGRTFRAWALVEMQIFRVYARLVGCTKTAQQDFIDRARGLKDRRKSIRKVVRDNAPHLQAEWHDIDKRIETQGERRHAFAHWTTFFAVNHDPPKGSPWLQRHYFHPKHNDPGARFGLTDLGQAIDDFEQLAEDIRAVAENRLNPPKDRAPLV